MDIKTALKLIINKKFTKTTQINFPPSIQYNELSLSHATNFIKGIQTSKKEYFINFLEEMKMFEIEIKNESRNEKINNKKFCMEFLKNEIDFDDLERIFKFLCVLANEELNFILHEEEIVSHSKNNSNSDTNNFLDTNNSTNNFVKAIQIDQKGRKDLLVQRIQPTLSLDEYAEMVLKNMKKREEKEKDAEYQEKVMSDLEMYDKEIEELKKMDEFKDEMVRGNTYRQS